MTTPQETSFRDLLDQCHASTRTEIKINRDELINDIGVLIQKFPKDQAGLTTAVATLVDDHIIRATKANNSKVERQFVEVKTRIYGLHHEFLEFLCARAIGSIPRGSATTIESMNLSRHRALVSSFVSASVALAHV